MNDSKIHLGSFSRSALRATFAASLFALLAQGACSSKPPTKDELGGGQVFTSKDAGMPDAALGSAGRSGSAGANGADQFGIGSSDPRDEGCVPRTCDDQ